MRRSPLFRLVDPSPRLRAALVALAAFGVLVLFLLGTRDDAWRFIPPEPFDKLAHVLVFGGFAAVAWLIGGGRFVVVPLLAAMAVGFADEGLQAFTPGRDPDWRDLVADFAGAFAAVAMLQLLRWRALAGAADAARALDVTGGRSVA
jgi:hypothetical protein